MWSWFRAAALILLDEQHLLHIVNLLKFDLDDLVLCGLHHTPHKSRLNRKLTPSAVNQHIELNACGAALVEESVKRGANSAACIQHIIEQDELIDPMDQAKITFPIFRWQVD